LLFRDNGGGAVDDTVKGCMRRVGGGYSTTSIWLSNKECLPLREKAMHALHYSTWRIWGEPLPPPAQVCGDQPCAGTGGGVAWKKDGFEFLCFAAKTVGCAAKW
jgi:hypothetical protein